ncbi:MAG: hypothetical protein J2P22_08960 [Nocardioides sp.]|nr:hypothetical protein [Nocardioides sp.]
MRRTLALTVTGLLLGGLALAGCAGRPASSAADPGPATAPSVHSHPVASTVTSKDPYVNLAEALHQRGVAIWYETDLVQAWLAGPTTFHQVVRRLAQLARVPGVVGFKIADELGYHDGIDSPEQGLAFLSAAHQALQKVAPQAQVLIDVVVPDLGCLPWLDDAGQTCAAQARAATPAATTTALTRYLQTGWIDRLDLSTSLLDESSYANRGLTLDDAQREAWAEVGKLGWGSLTMLQARKALAEPGGFQGSSSEAAADVQTYVQIPAEAGASAVDIWTWRQPYDGATVSLLPPSLEPNPLWKDLARLPGGSPALLTHMTPSQMPASGAALAHECDLVASVFSGVFVAAGTG